MRDVLSFTVGMGTVHETLFCQCDCIAVYPFHYFHLCLVLTCLKYYFPLFE